MAKNTLPSWTGYALIAVAIVAVLALVFSLKSTFISEGTSVVGEAAGLPFCKNMERCGYKVSATNLECKTFGNPKLEQSDSGYGVCKAQGFDACASATLIARITYSDTLSSLFSLPLHCDKNTPLFFGFSTTEELIKENLKGSYDVDDSDLSITCCRLS